MRSVSSYRLSLDGLHPNVASGDLARAVDETTHEVVPRGDILYYDLVIQMHAKRGTSISMMIMECRKVLRDMQQMGKHCEMSV